MDRFALLIDAGHLLAEGGKLCCGVGRGEIEWDPELIRAIENCAREYCGLEALRTYWYDAAPNAVPTREQVKIALLPRVKLRLGRLVGAKQKGVDSLIVRDLMTLARERAVPTMFLLGGDEDLREGVLAAQEMGVSVIILGVASSFELANQAESLLREADDHIVLSREFLAPFLSRRKEYSEGENDGISALQALENAAERGRAFARQELAGKSEEIERLLLVRPRIPTEIDKALLAAGDAALAAIEGREDLRFALRRGFWEEVRKMSEVGTPA